MAQNSMENSVFLTLPRRASCHQMNPQKSRHFMTFSPNFENRHQSFNVKPSSRISLIFGLPFRKYNERLIRDEEFQTYAINQELTLIESKSKELNQKFNNEEIVELFKKLSYESQVTLNRSLEETLGLLKEISTMVLHEHGNSPEEIGLPSIPSLFFELKENDELKVFKQNKKLHYYMFKALKGAIGAYNILNKQKDHKKFDTSACNLLFQYLARVRLLQNKLIEIINIHKESHTEKITYTKEPPKKKLLIQLQKKRPSRIKLPSSYSSIQLIQENASSPIEANTSFNNISNLFSNPNQTGNIPLPKSLYTVNKKRDVRNAIRLGKKLARDPALVYRFRSMDSIRLC
ncbi:unnamed protein product [Blepharisma stoltei]|uniref:Uncharacterized protein n=1 Tax=Blepharisma stoltei TaxID=1481888 RepID=A0AAU9JBQ5_9CILI|nr:unnamed protein product [Blepharisma stoltei]